jgi:selenium metabolism protein YedF
MAQNMVVLLGSATIGRGDDELGAILTRNFLRMLKDNEPRPKTLIFMNGGVKLAVADSPVLDELEALEKLGVELLCCGTCLDFFELRASVKVGRASNMAEIFERLSQADKVLSV